MLQEPSVIIAGIEALGEHSGESLAAEQAKTERDLRAVQIEEERLVRLYVTGKITEKMLDLQRKCITERMEHLRAKVDDFRARVATEVSRERMAESVQAWTNTVGQGLGRMSAEEQRAVLQEVVDEVTVDREKQLGHYHRHPAGAGRTTNYLAGITVELCGGTPWPLTCNGTAAQNGELV